MRNCGFAFIYLLLAHSLLNAADTLKLPLDSSGPFSVSVQQGAFTHTLSGTLQLHFDLQGTFSGNFDSGDGIYNLTQKNGTIRFFGTATKSDGFITESYQFSFWVTYSLGAGGRMDFSIPKGRVTYVYFSLNRSTQQPFQPNQVVFFNVTDPPSPFVRLVFDKQIKWAFNDFVDVTATASARTFMLTFDDGPKLGCTDKLLASLRTITIHGSPAKAGFFLVGDNNPAFHQAEWWHDKGSMRNNPELVRQIQNDGHFIGNHSQHHAYFPVYQDMFPSAPVHEFAQREVLAWEAEYISIFGAPPAIRLFRPPYLQRSSEMQTISEMSGYRLFYGVTAKDFAFAELPSFLSVSQIKGAARTVLDGWNGSEPCALIFHDIFDDVCENITDIVSYLRGTGHVLVDFDPMVSTGEQGTPGLEMKVTTDFTSSAGPVFSVQTPRPGAKLVLEETDALTSSTAWGNSNVSLLAGEDYYFFKPGLSRKQSFFRIRAD